MEEQGEAEQTQIIPQAQINGGDIDVKSLFPTLDEFSRYEDPNPLGLTNLEKAQKKQQVAELEKLFPRVPWKFLEMLWDYHHIQDKDELEKKINEGYFEKKTKKRIPKFENEEK